MIETEVSAFGSCCGYSGTGAARRVFSHIVASTNGQSVNGQICSFPGSVRVEVCKAQGGTWEGTEALERVEGSAAVGLWREGEPSEMPLPVDVQISGITVTCLLGAITQVMTNRGFLEYDHAIEVLRQDAVVLDDGMDGIIRHYFAQTDANQLAFPRIMEFFRLVRVTPWSIFLCAGPFGANLIVARHPCGTQPVYVCRQDGRFGFGGPNFVAHLPEVKLQALDEGHRVTIGRGRDSATYQLLYGGEAVVARTDGSIFVRQI